LGAFVGLHSGGRVPLATPKVAIGHPPPPTAPPPATASALSAGVEASWVVAENALPGTTAWRIVGTPPGTIAGFADHVVAQAGNQVVLYVSTNAPAFHVDAYRMGYYGGAGARLVWSSPTVPGHVQPSCPLTPGGNMVSCDNWSPSVAVAISNAFVQGDYLLKLVGSGGQQSYVPLTVWDPTSHATYLVKNDVYTWQAWNPYGGYDFYAGRGACPASVYPLCSRARVVSYDRPYGYVDGAADFLGSEYPLVQFVEQHGLDVTYVTDINVDEDPGILAAHRVLLSLGHDEAWSLTERQAAQGAEQHGMNVIFFAASPMLRHVRPQSSPIGPEREIVDYRDSSADPLNGTGNPLEVTGNTWSSPPANWSETPFVGESYAGFMEPGVKAAPFVASDAGSWIYAGTGLQNGATLPGVLGTDFDQFDLGSHPPNLEILGHSPIPTALAQTQRHAPFSDMTYYTDPVSGAGVFDSGINSWIPSLGPCTEQNVPCASATIVDHMTANLLELFGQGPVGHIAPSTPNWHAIYP
jgi:hypothetical protein